MTRIMYDAVTLSNCPTDGQLYACYVDGSYANRAEAERRFPGKRIVLITVTGRTLNAHVADVERGDLTPASGAAWAHRRKAAGYAPTLYCSTSVRPAVEAECRKLGLTLGRDYWIWEAHYDGVALLPAGAVAKQYLGDFHGYDKSVVADYWPGVDPKPVPTLSVPWWWVRVLRCGNVGPDVLALKRRLRRLGYAGVSLSPSFGPAVDGAVRHLQTKNRLPATGIVDRPTAHAIRVS